MRKTLMAVTIAMLAVAGFASLAMAAGGSASGVTGLAPSGHPTITGTVVMDPHMAGTTPTAKYAVVTLEAKSKKIPAASAVIQINEGFLLALGCNLGMTETRFVYTGTNVTLMRAWIPEGDLNALFAALGETVSAGEPVHDPVITAVTARDCIDNGSAVEGLLVAPLDGSLPGWLVMDFVVDFLGTGKK